MGKRMINGRTVLDRPGIAEYTGKSERTVQLWYSERPASGFPAVCHTDADGRQWFPQTEITAFWRAHQQAKESALTTIDRSGDRDDLLTAPEAAKVLGYRHRDNLPKVIIEQPDEAEELPSGRLRRRWRRSTLWAYADGRIADPPTGRPIGTSSGPRKAHPYADDPRLPAAKALLDRATAEGRSTRGLGVELARTLDIDERTALRLIKAALTAA